MRNKKITKQGLHESAAIFLLATALVKIIGALFKIPISSDYCLGDLGFGYFSAAYDFFSPVYTITVSGFPVAVAKIVADFTAKNKFENAQKAFFASRRLLFWLGILASLLMVGLSFPFVRFTDATGKSLYGMLAIAPSFMFCFWSSAYRGYFEGLHNMSYPAVSSVIEALGKLILGLGFALVTVAITSDVALGATAALAGITVGNIAGTVYLCAVYKRRISTLPERDETEKSLSQKELYALIISIAVPVVLSSMSGSMVALTDALTVRWQLTAEVAKSPDLYGGIYEHFAKEFNISELPTFLYGIRSKAYTIYNLVPSVTVALGVSAIPTLTEAFAKGDKKQAGRNAGVVLKLSALITLPIAAGFIFAGKSLMALLYGNGASAEIGGIMLSLYGVAVAFSGIFIPLSCVLQAVGKQNIALYNVAAGVVIKIVLNLILCGVAELNIFGAVISTIVCNAVIFVLHFVTLIKSIGFSFGIKNAILKPFVSALCCGITAYFITLLGDSSLITLGAIAAAGAVYITVAAIINTFCEEDILSLPAGEKLLKICKTVKIIR